MYTHFYKWGVELGCWKWWMWSLSAWFQSWLCHLLLACSWASDSASRARFPHSIDQSFDSKCCLSCMRWHLWASLHVAWTLGSLPQDCSSQVCSAWAHTTWPVVSLWPSCTGMKCLARFYGIMDNCRGSGYLEESATKLMHSPPELIIYNYVSLCYKRTVAVVTQ